MAPRRLDAADAAHLEEHGFCVVRGLVDPELCAAARAMVDRFFGDSPAEAVVGGQPGPWPDDDGDEVIMSANWAHSLMHPIRDPLPAQLVAPMVPVMSDALCADVSSLKLISQNFRRTDPSPPPEGGYIPLVAGVDKHRGVAGMQIHGEHYFHIDRCAPPPHTHTLSPLISQSLTLGPGAP